MQIILSWHAGVDGESREVLIQILSIGYKDALPHVFFRAFILITFEYPAGFGCIGELAMKCC